MPLQQLLALAAALIQPTVAPSPSPPAPVQHMVRHAPPPPEVEGDEAMLPLEFTAGMPTFTATIHGKPFKFGFDTGAPGPARLTDKAAEALGLEPVGEVMASDPTGRNPQRRKLYALDAMSLGGLTIRKWLTTADPVHPGKLESLDGIIGLSAFSGFVVTLDYAGRRLRIVRGALPPADGKTIFEYKDDPIPLLTLSVEGRQITAHLDTGNVVEGIIVPESFAAGLANRAQARRVGQARTVSNVVDILAFDLAGDAKVGDVALDARRVAFPSLMHFGNIGSKALTGLILKVDPANGRIAFERPLPSAS